MAVSVLAGTVPSKVHALTAMHDCAIKLGPRSIELQDPAR